MATCVPQVAGGPSGRGAEPAQVVVSGRDSHTIRFFMIHVCSCLHVWAPAAPSASRLPRPALPAHAAAHRSQGLGAPLARPAQARVALDGLVSAPTTLLEGLQVRPPTEAGGVVRMRTTGADGETARQPGGRGGAAAARQTDSAAAIKSRPADMLPNLVAQVTNALSWPSS